MLIKIQNKFTIIPKKEAAPKYTFDTAFFTSISVFWSI